MASILIVDDDSACRELLRTVLSASRHRVTEARDGEEALRLAHQEPPDLVISDILMPTMDGFELVRQIRKDDLLKITRVIFCSASYLQRETEALAKACGVLHTILKPIEPETFTRLIRDVLHEPEDAPVPAPDGEEFHRQHAQLASDLAARKSAEQHILNKRLEALIDVGNQLAAEPNAERLLEKFCTGARYVLAAKYAAVILVGADRKAMTTVAISGARLKGPPAVDFERLAQDALTRFVSNEPALRMHYPQFRAGGFRIAAVSDPLPTCMAVRIGKAGHEFGLFLAAGKLGGPDFSDEDERVAGLLASQVAVCYENVLRFAALRESEARVSDLVENAAYGIARCSNDGRFTYVNPAMVNMLGYGSAAELLSVDLKKDLYRNPADREPFLEKVLENTRVSGHEVDWKRRDGAPVLVRVTGRTLRNDKGEVAGLEIIVEDVTSLRALEKHNRQLQKFEAIGQLAGGIAHDFNNAIGAVKGWAEIGRSKTPRDSPLGAYFDKISDQANRSAGLTRQLLAFARRQILEPQDIDLNQDISAVMGLLRPTIGEDIEVKLGLSPEAMPVRADPVQLEQVLMNLCLNGRDAMPKGGKLIVETSQVVFDDDFCHRHPYARPGEFVLLAVTDTGTGMDAATMDHVFEPFFTTKEMGRGTGLGLSTVYGIVKQHGGFIHVYSEPGLGSTFRVYLPRVGGGTGPKPPLPSEAPVRKGTETILVVEDQQTIREIVREMLEGLGYTVLLAEDGLDGVAKFEAGRDSIDIVLLDVVLPKLGGAEACEKMRESRRDLPVVFITGYSGEHTRIEALIQQGAEILRKPFGMAALGRKVREVLDRGKAK